jgi:hypothetical protein
MMIRDTTSLFSYNADGRATHYVEWYLPNQTSFAGFEAARESVERNVYAQANWDGYGALPVSSETRKNALSALSGLEHLAPAPAVIPNPNGTISFEWETEKGIGHLEVGRTRFSFYIRRTSGIPFLLDGSAVDQIYGLGPILSGELYPTPSQPAYTRIVTSADV